MTDGPHDPDLLAGRYRRVRTLGSGGMGDVWLAVDVELDRQVAVKRLRVDVPGGAGGELVERMMREARVVARLKHPSIVTLYDLVRVEALPHLILEYVEGESLADRIAREGTTGWRDTARIVADTAAGLAAAHRAGVQHRDVKPGNVLIDRAGRGHLADFGIARGAEDVAITRAGEMIGTLAFMPPEIARQEDAGPASDVWSLGATFYAAVEGHPPFVPGGADVPAIIARLVQQEAPPPSRAGAASGLVTRMLASDPRLRPTADQVVVELERLLSQAPPVTTGPLPSPPPPAPPTREVDAVAASGPHHAPTIHATPAESFAAPARRRRGGPVAAAVLAAVLIVGGVVAYVALQGSPGTGPDDTTDDTADSGGPTTGPTSSTSTATGAPFTTPVDLGTASGVPVVAADGSGPIYVADTDADQVVLVDPTSGEPTRIDVCEAPSTGITVLPGGTRAVVPCGGPLVQVVDGTGNVADIELDGTPAMLRSDPEGRYVFAPLRAFANGSGAVAIIDAATMTVSTTIPTTGEPGQVVSTTDGTAAYFPDHDGRRVFRIDTPDDPDQITWTEVDMAGEPNGLQPSADNSLVYVTLDSDEVQVIERSDDAGPDDAREPFAAPGASDGRIRVRPGTTDGWIPNRSSDNVQVVDLTTGDSLGSAATYGRPGVVVVFNPTGSQAYVLAPDQGVIKDIDPDDLDDVTDLAGFAGDAESFAMARDGSVLYVLSSRGDRTQLTAVPLG